MISSIKINIFRRLIYLSCLFHTIISYRVYRFQSDLKIFEFHHPLVGSRKFEIFVTNNLMWLYSTLVIVLMMGIIKGYSNRIFSIIVYVLLIVVEKSIWPVLDGGNNFVHLVVFFLIIIDERKNKNKKINGIFEKLIIYQLCIVYFFSVISKFQNPLWLNGTAIFYVLTGNQYTLDWVSSLVKSVTPSILVIPTYFILFYQFTYPIGVFHSELKKIYVIFGIFFHLFIGIIIGLPSFAVHFIMAYSIFLNYKTLKWVLRRKANIALIIKILKDKKKKSSMNEIDN